MVVLKGPTGLRFLIRGSPASRSTTAPRYRGTSRIRISTPLPPQVQGYLAHKKKRLPTGLYSERYPEE